MDRDAASRHRQRINSLRQERHALEEALLEARELLRGSLVAQNWASITRSELTQSS